MNNTTQSSFEQDSSLSNVGVKAASLFIFFLVGVYSNGRVIYTVLLDDALRPVLNLFVASLSFADLASCLIVMPFVFVSLVSGEWLFGSIFCTIHAMLCTYFFNVAFLSVASMVYERYQAIYHKRFPSLSNRHTTIFLCFIWIFPIPFTASIYHQEFAYVEHAGLCFDADDHRNPASIINASFVKVVGLILMLFSFWKIFAFLLSRRRRVSPGLPSSNEDSLTLAAFVQSALTSIVFVLVYLIMTAPIAILVIVNKRRRGAGKSTSTEELISAFLWMYWLQCAIKPIIYVLRSQRCTSFLCQCHCTEMANETTSSCSSRSRSRVYEVREDSSQNSHSRITGGRLPALPTTNNEFLDLCRISIELVPVTGVTRSVHDQDQTTGRNVTNDARSVPEQDRTAGEIDDWSTIDFVCIQDAVEHSAVLREDLKSYVGEIEEVNSYHDEVPDYGNFKASPILEEALELEDIEHMFDEAINSQQKEWARNASYSKTHCP